jgi:dGTPase
LNVALTEAIALGHDCGHGPGGHASEDAFSPYLAEGYNHAVWGADVILAPLNLCAETLDGVRHHSWSLPSPITPEGAVVSWADRCAYCAHDFEDAAGVGIVSPGDLPAAVAEVAGRSRTSQLRCFINALVDCVSSTGEIGMRQPYADALASLRGFNYERIYTRPSSVAQGEAVIAVLSSLVEFFAANPARITPAGPGLGAGRQPEAGEDAEEPKFRVRQAITYVSGMTDRFAFSTAIELLGWRRERLPRGIDASDWPLS